MFFKRFMLTQPFRLMFLIIVPVFNFYEFTNITTHFTSARGKTEPKTVNTFYFEKLF
jgi:hypothetical protein